MVRYIIYCPLKITRIKNDRTQERNKQILQVSSNQSRQQNEILKWISLQKRKAKTRIELQPTKI